MRRLVLALLLTGQPIMAQPSRRTLVAEESRVWFEASATLGAFQGQAQRMTGWADAPDTLHWNGAAGQVQIEVASFGTGIALRNRHLREYMEVDRYPLITFVLDRVEPGEARAVTLHGRMTMHGTTRSIAIPATIAGSSPLILDGRLDTRFTEWGMQPARRMGGLTKVRDPIVLRFHAVFR
jgi:polyisoprenoid-binding protein YceI